MRGYGRSAWEAEQDCLSKHQEWRMWLSGNSAQQVLDSTSTTEGGGGGRQGKECSRLLKLKVLKMYTHSYKLPNYKLYNYEHKVYEEQQRGVLNVKLSKRLYFSLYLL